MISAWVVRALVIVAVAGILLYLFGGRIFSRLRGITVAQIGTGLKWLLWSVVAVVVLAPVSSCAYRITMENVRLGYQAQVEAKELKSKAEEPVADQAISREEKKQAEAKEGEAIDISDITRIFDNEMSPEACKTDWEEVPLSDKRVIKGTSGYQVATTVALMTRPVLVLKAPGNQGGLGVSGNSPKMELVSSGEEEILSCVRGDPRRPDYRLAILGPKGEFVPGLRGVTWVESGPLFFQIRQLFDGADIPCSAPLDWSVVDQKTERYVWAAYRRPFIPAREDLGDPEPVPWGRLPFLVTDKEGDQPKEVNFTLHLTFTPYPEPTEHMFVCREDSEKYPVEVVMLADDVQRIYLNERISTLPFVVTAEDVRKKWKADHGGQELPYTEGAVMVKWTGAEPAMAYLTIRITP